MPDNVPLPTKEARIEAISKIQTRIAELEKRKDSDSEYDEDYYEFIGCPLCGFRMVWPDDRFFIQEHFKSWHPSLRFQAERVRTWIFGDEELKIFRATTIYERRLVVDLIGYAQLEELEFRWLGTKSLRKFFIAYGCVISSEIAGYSVWNYLRLRNLTLKQADKKLKERTRTLRQIFLLPEFRGQGYGNKLIDAALFDLRVKPDETWTVESPNNVMIGLLRSRADAKRIEVFSAG